MKFKIINCCKYIFILAFCGVIYTAKAQDKIFIKGYMLDESTFEPVPLANILISNAGTKAISNRSGLFRISILPNDSILITAIGYEQKLFIGHELIPTNITDTIRIYLRPTVYKLKDVNVVYSNHKRDSIARLAAEYLKNDPLLNNYDRVINRPRGSAMSPLTAMYEEWSKAGIEMQKFEDFLQYAETQKAIDRRYNKKVIKQVTDIEDSNMDEFILFCKLDRTFILTAPEYDLYLAIRKCADEFNGKKMKERTRLR